MIDNRKDAWQWLLERVRPQGYLSTAADSGRSERAIPPARLSVASEPHCAGATDIGKAREDNEDGFFFDVRCGLLAVADGVGGQAAGEVASAIALCALRGALPVGKAGENSAARFLQQAFAAAEAAIERRAREDSHCAGMATTLAAALIDEDRLTVCHAGDVRAYLYRQTTLTRLTDDHTPVGKMLRNRLIDDDAARHHPRRSEIIEALGGGKRPVAVDLTQSTLHPGDVVLLCTDGLWSEVGDADIIATLRDWKSAEITANYLVDQALAANGSDNVTALVYKHRA